MYHIKIIINILSAREKALLFYMAFLMLINILLELLGIGILLPAISVLLKNDLSFLPINLSNLIIHLKHENLINLFLLLIVFVYIVKNLYIVFYLYYQGTFLKKLQIRILLSLYKKYLFQNYQHYLQKNTGIILRNLNVTRLISLCLLSYMSLTLEMLITFSFLVYLLYLDFFSTIITSAIFISFGGIFYIFTRKKLYFFGKERQSYDAKINQNILQTFTNIKNIKIFSKEKKIFFYFKKMITYYENIALKSDILQQLPKVFVEILGIVSISFLIFFLLLSNRSAEEIFIITASYAAVAFRLIPGVTRIITSSQRIKNLSPSLELIKEEFLDFSEKKETLDIFEGETNKIKFESIKFQDVCFSYFENDNFVLSNINIQINRGQIVGIYGNSGSGKSTFVNLISGLIKPTSGEIKINNQNLENQKKNWLATLGYVPQNTTLFNDTIGNNITFFETKNTQKKLDDSLIKSNLKDFINSLPDKENTIVGENSSKLSGGQIQRIGIARALFNNPDFIIFDESTNSLDETNENNIMKFIYSLRKEKTVLVISHKIEILNSCDKIFKVENNKIEEVK